SRPRSAIEGNPVARQRPTAPMGCAAYVVTRLTRVVHIREGGARCHVTPGQRNQIVHGTHPAGGILWVEGLRDQSIELGSPAHLVSPRGHLCRRLNGDRRDGGGGDSGIARSGGATSVQDGYARHARASVAACRDESKALRPQSPPAG